MVADPEFMLKCGTGHYLGEFLFLNNLGPQTCKGFAARADLVHAEQAALSGAVSPFSTPNTAWGTRACGSSPPTPYRLMSLAPSAAQLGRKCIHQAQSGFCSHLPSL